MNDNEKKKLEIAELYPVLLSFPVFVKYFDIKSDKLLDEKISVLKQLKDGKQISDIANFYDIFELLPDDAHYD